MKKLNSITLSVSTLVLVALGTPQAFAGKPGGGAGGGSSAGVVTIDQNSAANGGVTSGDAPGFPVTISEPGSYRLESNMRGFLSRSRRMSATPQVVSGRAV